MISDKHIDKAVAKVEKMTEKSYEKFFQQFDEQQPFLFEYLLTYSEAMHKEEARDEFIFIVSVIWECYRTLKLPLDMVTVKEIEKVEKAQMKDWEKLNAITDPTEEEKFVTKFIKQPLLWNFMTQTAVPDIKNIKKSHFSNDDDFAILYSCTKTMMDLLDLKVKKAESKKE